MFIDINNPTKKYSVLLADPPWKFKTYSNKGQAKSPEAHYETMNPEDIQKLPIPDLMDKNSALLLWAIWPKMREALDLIDYWGFKYSGLAWEWIKYNETTDKFHFGLGYGTRKNLEPCILARKGSPNLKSHSVRDFMFAKKREHSRKPDEQYNRIEMMYDGPYLELFPDMKEKIGIVGEMKQQNLIMNEVNNESRI